MVTKRNHGQDDDPLHDDEDATGVELDEQVAKSSGHHSGSRVTVEREHSNVGSARAQCTAVSCPVNDPTSVTGT